MNINNLIYFDESGNSGPNLLDKDQPTLLLLSHNYTEEEARQILEPLLSISQASELHFKKLKKYARSREAILKCINHPLIERGRIYHYVALKKFMVVIQMVDQLVEQVLYRGGVDIYKGGLNISTANVIYLMGTSVWDKTLFDEMCEGFVKWYRTGHEADAEQFYASVDNLFITLDNEQDKELLFLIAASKDYIDDIMRSYNPFTLDATLSMFVAHCTFWAEIYKHPFDIVTDTSKQIAYWRGMIDFLTQSLPAQEVGFGSRKHKYPLLINSLSMGDSEQILQIQLADIMASCLNVGYTFVANNSTSEFYKKIDESRLMQTDHHFMWPTTAVTPEALDMTDESGINPLDFIAHHALLKPEDYKKADKFGK